MSVNLGHGHVRPRPDGLKAKCGGPGICAECAREAAQVSADRPVTPGADGITDEERRSPLFAAARAWCLARYEYGPVELYVSPEARERHIDHDANRTAADPAFLAAFEAMVDALVACGQAVHAGATRDEIDQVGGVTSDGEASRG